MDLSNTAIRVLGALVLIAMAAAISYIVRGARRNREGSGERSYNWQPEQDYDVTYSDEGPMSPPWPTLKRREKKTPPDKVSSNR